jgi:hypothetical protein
VSCDSCMRRAQRNAAIVAAHPNWHGIRHPELIDFPPPSATADAKPAGLTRPGTEAQPQRIRAAALVAAHPNWHGVRHPDRIEFVPRRDEREAQASFAWAVRRARRDLSESAALYARIAAVAERAHSRLETAAAPRAAGASAPTFLPRSQPRRATSLRTRRLSNLARLLPAASHR